MKKLIFLMFVLVSFNLLADDSYRKVYKISCGEIEHEVAEDGWIHNDYGYNYQVQVDPKSENVILRVKKWFDCTLYFENIRGDFSLQTSKTSCNIPGTGLVINSMFGNIKNLDLHRDLKNFSMETEHKRIKQTFCGDNPDSKESVFYHYK